MSIKHNQKSLSNFLFPVGLVGLFLLSIISPCFPSTVVVNQVDTLFPIPYSPVLSNSFSQNSYHKLQLQPLTQENAECKYASITHSCINICMYVTRKSVLVSDEIYNVIIRLPGKKSSLLQTFSCYPVLHCCSGFSPGKYSRRLREQIITFPLFLLVHRVFCVCRYLCLYLDFGSEPIHRTQDYYLIHNLNPVNFPSLFFSLPDDERQTTKSSIDFLPHQEQKPLSFISLLVFFTIFYILYSLHSRLVIFIRFSEHINSACFHWRTH